jgi:acetate CoA/acetoacetate CoA-transferase alpha subunit
MSSLSINPWKSKSRSLQNKRHDHFPAKLLSADRDTEECGTPAPARWNLLLERPPMRRAISAADAAALIPDGASLMIGGFMGVGTPGRIIDALVARNASGLTVIANDTARPGLGIGKLISAGCVARAIVSHIGTNPETQQRMLAETLQVELVPQGTLAERIRAGGAGLGGILTPTGIGTVVAEGKQQIVLDGVDYLLERPLRADFALILAHEADYNGNLTYRLTATNFNPVMAMAADVVIAEPAEIVPTGVIPPDAVKTPGILVTHLLERPC